MKYVYVFFVLIAFLFIVSDNVEARSGCCSHHGGVCGCGCCDGSSLSSTCAPYYPQCNAVPIPKTPTTTPKPIYIPKPSVKALAPINSPVVQGANTSKSESDNWTTAIVASLVGAGAYHLFTKSKKDQN